LSGGHSSPPGGAGARARRTIVRWLPAVAALAVVSVTVSLGNWQLRRADEKETLLRDRALAERATPVSLPRSAVDPAALDGRLVVVRGEYVPARAVFIDNRARNGVAGFQLVMPMRIEGSDRHVLVLRGWLPRDPRERTRLPEFRTPAGLTEVTGVAEATIAQAFELQRAPAPGPGDRIWQNLDFEVFESWSQMTLQRVLLRQSPDPGTNDGLIRDPAAAGPDGAKNRGYAFQWYALAATTLGLWLYFSFFRRRIGSGS
jgi:surfeit locus 1 family protein